jgi:hypothetical protein
MYNSEVVNQVLTPIDLPPSQYLVNTSPSGAFRSPFHKLDIDVF